MILQDTRLAICDVSRSVSDPKDSAEVAQRIIPRLNDERLYRKGDERDDSHAHEEKGKQERNRQAQTAKRDERDIGALAGDGGIGFPSTQHFLVHHHDSDTDQDENQRHHIAIARIQPLQCAIELRRQHVVAHGRSQEGGHCESTHRAGKGQQEGREQRRLHHRKRDAFHDLPAGCVQELRRFFEARIHVFQDAADQDVGEGRIVEALHNGNREKAIGEPVRCRDAGQNRKEPRHTTHKRISEKVQPRERQRPRWHDVRHDEERREEGLILDICPRDEPCHAAAEENGDCAGRKRDEHGIPERFVENAHARRAVQKHFRPVIVREIPGMRAADTHHFRGVHRHRVEHDGEQRQKRQKDQRCKQQHQDDVVRFAEKHPQFHRKSHNMFPWLIVIGSG